ncbi:hypothetical protein NC652_017285 [Populus alba x Populus x berolinensis]|nr:hypothetical protein NC652_017285 [Populus alba x Populus x berolinensis]
MNAEPTVSPEKSQFLHQGSIIPVLEGDTDDVIITIRRKSADSMECENPQAPKLSQHVEL